MTDRPEVSVVMAVYNGNERLSRSIDSVLGQEGVSLEFIIVDDGSTDESADILGGYAAQDSRVKILRQDNHGLTRALIKGCEAAEGEFIARQDVGDVSLPGKLTKQMAWLRADHFAAIISCGTRFVGPGGEFLFNVLKDPLKATTGLLALNLNEIQGLSSHPSAMFPRTLYCEVGGYRPAFYFAQDLDLWIRLAERGSHKVVPEVLYEASFNSTAISGVYRKEQVETAGLILECAGLRRKGLSEAPVLERAEKIVPSLKRPGRFAQADALYFLGTCLRESDAEAASKYFRQALKSCPLHVKSALRLLTS
jgi:glycosyltransferase involved in cell wall biosynthesis